MFDESNARYEAQENGLWLDRSDEAAAWRERVFDERRAKRKQAERSDIERTAGLWERWCGPNQWSIALRDFGALGGRCEYWGGVPRSNSAIGLTFTLARHDGSPLPCQYRLRDIKSAIETLKTEAFK